MFSVQVIRKANDVLCGISHPSVCSEVLLSAQGKSYISGVVEVYKVSKRVEGGMRTHGFVNEALQSSVKDIELLWNNLQAFLTFSPAVLQTLVIRKANDVLCGISHPSVCSEVLLSAQGKSYISGVVEVYKVSKRVEGGMRTHGFVNEALQSSVKDIELLWNNLQAFLTFSPSVLQTLVRKLLKGF
ncbi:UNVERIFIED_CONTAM: hypothetical protein FKN15_023172 [Acipenser sinensis]